MEPAEKLLQELDRKKRQWKRAAVFTTIIPVLLMVFFTWYARREIHQLHTQEEILQGRVDSLRVSIAANRKYFQERSVVADSAEAMIKQEAAKGTLTPEKITLIFRNLLRADSTAKRFNNLMVKVDSHKVSIRMSGEMQIDRPAAKKLIFLLFQLQGSKWKTGGSSPEEGFDDEGLINYTLNEINATASEERPVSGPLQDGDIVILENGYSMFYFKVNSMSFYLGMTEGGMYPLGLTFCKVVKYRKVTFN